MNRHEAGPALGDFEECKLKPELRLTLLDWPSDSHDNPFDGRLFLRPVPRLTIVRSDDRDEHFLRDIFKTFGMETFNYEGMATRVDFSNRLHSLRTSHIFLITGTQNVRFTPSFDGVACEVDAVLVRTLVDVAQKDEIRIRFGVHSLSIRTLRLVLDTLLMCAMNLWLSMRGTNLLSLTIRRSPASLRSMCQASARSRPTSSTAPSRENCFTSPCWLRTAWYTRKAQS